MKLEQTPGSFFLFDHPSDLYFPFTCVVLCLLSGYFSILTHGGFLSSTGNPQCFIQVKRMNVSCGCLSPANLQAVPWFRPLSRQAGIPPTNCGYFPAM